jgi:filamentous hemagglutinin family protein
MTRQSKHFETARLPARHANLVTALLLSAVPAIALYASAADAQALSAAGGKANRPSIAITANGTPVVNIAAPNAAGLSHNKFTDYNVGAAGLVLNNSRTPVQTQLGGVIAGNSQLGAKPAKVILNEVIGANPTMLNGTTEIAGKSAHLIVANPNGITVNGGGFINAPRTTLTTGKATFDSLGNIANIDTTRGRIEIQGKGLDATRIDQLDLIARSIAVNAALHAEGAKVVGVGGVTRHNLKSDTTQSATDAGLKGEGSAPRTVAIDVSKLGSMYANSIRLVGSRDGVGVNDNNGAGTPVSARSMPEWGIDSGRINVNGLIQAGSGGASFSTGSLTVIGKTGTVTSARGLSVSGGTRNEGNILARTLSVENLDNSTGTLKTTGKMSVSGSTENTLGRIDVGSASFVGAVSNDRGVIHSAGKLNAAGLVNNILGEISAQSIAIDGRLYNEHGGLLRSGSTIKVNGYTSNNDGTIEYVSSAKFANPVDGVVTKLKPGNVSMR